MDPSQNGKYAAPVMTLAKKIGIPVVLVDIRMEASHQELPSLATLRHGSERALQWLFERYWRAQRNVLDAVRDGACECVAELVTAEAARREKAELVDAAAAANRGKGKTKRRRGTSSGAGRGGRGDDKDDDDDDDDDEDDEDEDDDDDDDDAFVGVNEARDFDGEFDQSEGPNAAASSSPKGTAKPKKRKDTPATRRRDALNRLANVVHKDDTKTVVEALLVMGAAVARAEAKPPEPDEVERTTMEDWKATAVRLKKRWEYVHEDLVLRAVDRALEERPKEDSGRHGNKDRTNASGSVAATRDVEMVAKAAVEVFAQHTLEMGPEKRPEWATVLFGPGNVGDGGAVGDAGPKTRQKALTWHLLRRTMSLPDPTKGQTELGEALLAAVGGGRKFSARAGALLSGERLPSSDKKGKDKGRGGRGNGGENKGTDKEQPGGGGRKEPVRAGPWTLVEDWTPCALGDIPAHLRDVDPSSPEYRPMVFGSAPNSSAPPRPNPADDDDDDAMETKEEIVAEFPLPDPSRPRDGSPHATVRVPDDPPMGSVTAVADLLWGAWPKPRPTVGFGEAVPGVDYSVGAPFVDPTRRMMSLHEGQADTPYVRDAGVIGREEIASGHKPLKNPPKDGSHLKPGFVRRPGRSVGVGRGGGEELEWAIEDGMNFGFVDLEDDEVTEELEGYEASGAAEEVDMETADDEEMEEEEEEEEEEAEEEEGDGGVDGAGGGDDDDGDRGGDGMAVSIGGVRVVLSAEDRDAVASNVECLM